MHVPSEHEILDDLTPAQREAVTHFEGPLLILAGPGSGKTRVITRRVAYLMTHHRVRPENILAVTFTNKAAGEMRQRIWKALPGSIRADDRGVEVPPHRFLRISTFHSFGVYFLRRYADRFGLDKRFTIYDQDDRARLTKKAMEEADIDAKRITPERVAAAISKAKNRLIRPEKFGDQARDFIQQMIARVYPVYEKKMRTANAFDFDDLLYWPALALKNDPEIRSELDSRFKFVLIDEYQDTNLAQYEISKRLCQDYRNLCVVGDPDQSIYKFRGADIRNILDFERDFPDAKVVTLDRNYRSTKSILRAADSVIAYNRKRKPKTLVTDNEQGHPVTVLTFETGLDEADRVIGRIADAVRMGERNYRDFAIFLRINALSRSLETACISQRVPYQIVKGLAFFDRKENKDILAYLRLLLNPQDDLAFLRIVNEPPRGIGKVSLDHLQKYAQPREMSLLSAAAEVSKIPAIKGKASNGLRDFCQLMADLREVLEHQPDEVIRQVLDRSGYRAMLKTSDNEEDQERLANIEELITAAKQFAAEDADRTIADFLESVTLASDVDGMDESQDSVAIMTLHAAKGLEFPVVYMLAVEQGLLPHERSLGQDEEVEEERRLAFVGMTRAKEELYVTHGRLREFRGNTLYSVPSMFLDELPQEGIENLDLSHSGAGTATAIHQWRSGSDASKSAWEAAGVAALAMPTPAAANPNAGKYAEGMLVKHDEYGRGQVTEVSGHGVLRKVKVRFSTAGVRTFLAEKAKLIILTRD